MDKTFETKVDMMHQTTLDCSSALRDMWPHGEHIDTLRIYLRGVLAPMFAMAMNTANPMLANEAVRKAVLGSLIDLVQESTIHCANDVIALLREEAKP